MLSRVRDRNVWIVNATILSVGMACGIAISIIALHLDGRGYSKADIGSLAAWFALGIAATAIPVGALIRKWSAKGVLVSSVLLYAATVSVFPHVTHSFPAAAAVRVLDGAASAGIWVGCETILLMRAGHKDKAFVMSLYAASIGLGYMLGPFAAKLIVWAGSMDGAFGVAGVLSLATAILVWWRLDPDPEPEAVAELAVPSDPTPSAKKAALADATPLGELLWRVKCSLLGTFAYGYFQASAVLFLPLYLISAKGVDRELTILVPGFFALGMMSFVLVAGRLGDRYGHLRVMRILAVLGTSTVLAFVWLQSFWAMCISVTLAGASLASISPLSLALQGVVVRPADYSRANGIYNALYALGMMIGPPISGYLFEHQDGATMLYQMALMWVAFAIFARIFAADDPAHQRERTSPGASPEPAVPGA